MKQLDLPDLPDAIGNLVEEVRVAQQVGIVATAVLGVQWIKLAVMRVSGNPPHKPFDIGTFRNSWMFRSTEYGAYIYNESPQAVFINGGVQPENVKPGKKMRDAIAEWAVRKGIADESNASSLAWAISMKMKKTGIFQDDQFRFTKRAVVYLREEIAKQVSAELDKIKWKAGK